MSYISAVNSLYINPNGSGATPSLEEVLVQSNDAGGESIINLLNLEITGAITGNSNASLDTVHASVGIISDGNLVVSNQSNLNGELIVAGLSTLEGGLTVDSPTNINGTCYINSGLNISGSIYPVLGSPLVYPNLGSIRVVNLQPSPVPLAYNVSYTTTITYQRGIYSGKAEIDFVISTGVYGYGVVEIFYGTIAGTNIGYSSSAIGGGHVATAVVPFFMNVLTSGDIITIRISAYYDNAGSPTWNTTTESDVDVLRIF